VLGFLKCKSLNCINASQKAAECSKNTRINGALEKIMEIWVRLRVQIKEMFNNSLTNGKNMGDKGREI
jgi:hypothetical protein